MGAATPDAYRVGAGSATPDYPGGVPARLPEQPVMPGTPSVAAPVAKETFAPAASSVLKDGHPQIAALSPDVERTIIARVPPRDRYPAIPKSSPITKPTPVVRSAPKDEYTSAVVTPSASTYPQRSAEPSAPVRPPALPTPPLSRFTPQDVTSEAREEVASDREYAHHDEANAPFFGDGGEDDWNAERDLPTRADVALSRRLGPTRAVPGDQVVARLSEAEKERRREARAYRYEELDQRPPLRRERPKRHKRIKRGLGMFAFGFVLALVLAVGGVMCLSYLRTVASDKLAHSLDACSVNSPYARLASDNTTLTLVAYGEGANGLSQTDFRCILDQIDTPSSVRERMLITRAVDGTQDDVWGTYRATWTYHPEDGLNVVLAIR